MLLSLTLSAVLAVADADAGTEIPPVPIVDAGVPAVASGDVAMGIFTVRPFLSADIDARVQSNEIEGQSGFMLRRMRVGVRVKAADWVEAVGRLQYSPDADQKVGLYDAFLELSPFRDWRVSMGFHKSPLFISARDEHMEALSVPELPLPVRTFWPGRDVSLEVHRLPTATIPFEGFLRVSNGSGSPAGNDDARLAFEGRFDFAIGRAQPGVDASHNGFRIGVGAHYEDNAVEHGGFGGSTASTFRFWKAPTVIGARTLAEAHLTAWVNRFVFRAEGAYSWEARSVDDDGNPMTPRVTQPTINAWGAYAEVAYMVLGTPRLPGKWGNVTEDWTDWRHLGLEVAGRFEWLEVGLHGGPTVVSSGARGGSLAVRAWMTRWLALSAAGYMLAYERPPLDEPTQSLSWQALLRLSFAIQ